MAGTTGSGSGAGRGGRWCSAAHGYLARRDGLRVTVVLWNDAVTPPLCVRFARDGVTVLAYDAEVQLD